MGELSKTARHALLRELLQKGGAQSQQELQREMQRRGHAVSQITISRDLRDIGAVKVPGPDGRRYSLGAPGSPSADALRLKRVFSEFVRSIEPAGQFIVIKTPPSGAQPVGLALDQSGIEEIAGTIAGDDTVFVLVRGTGLVPGVLKRLQALLG